MLAVSALALAIACAQPLLGASLPLQPPALADDLSAQAEAQFAGARDAAAFAAATATARAALRSGPLESRALRVLGFEAEREGRGTDAAAIMRITAQRTLRDNLTQTWLLERALKARDYDAAFRLADTILIRRSDFETVLFPALTDALKDPQALAPAARELSLRPPWRTGFVRTLSWGSPAPELAQQLLQRLLATSAPPSDEEVAYLVSRLVALQRFGDARQAWARLGRLPATASSAAIYDGEFKGLPGVEPFNWRLQSADGRFAELATISDGSALHIEAHGGAQGTLAEQTLALPPGAYELSGQGRVDGSSGDDLLAWQLECLPHGERMMEVAQSGSAGRWASVSAMIRIPVADCPAQVLRLTALPRRDFADLQAWYRGFKIDARP